MIFDRALMLDGVDIYTPSVGRYRRVAWVQVGHGQPFFVEVATFYRDGEEVGPGACELADGTCKDAGGSPPCGGCYYCFCAQAQAAKLEIRFGYAKMLVSHRLAWDDALHEVACMCDEEEFLAAEASALLRGLDQNTARREGSRAIHDSRLRWGAQ